MWESAPYAAFPDSKLYHIEIDSYSGPCVIYFSEYTSDPLIWRLNNFSILPLIVLTVIHRILCVCVCVWVISLFSHVWLFATLWTTTCKVSLSIGFSSHENWSGLSCPPPGDLPNPGIKPMSLTSPALAGFFCCCFLFFLTTNITWETHLGSYTSSKAHLKSFLRNTSRLQTWESVNLLLAKVPLINWLTLKHVC